MGKAHRHSINQAYYAVIVADVRYDKTLKPNAKLLYGELTALCNQYGYCWATNEYFADLYGLASATVSRLISQLESRGYIRCEMAATETGSERRIYAGAFVVRPLTGGIDENVKTPLDKNVNTPLDEIVNPQYENNINISPYSPPKGDEYSPAQKRNKCEPDWELFDRFWAAYPKKKNKASARRAWRRLAPSLDLCRTMADALEKDKQSRAWQKNGGEYIPYPASWLNGRRWEDEHEPDAAAHDDSPAEPLRGEGVQYL